MKKFVIMAFALVLAGCTNQDRALRVLESSGYTEIRFNGYGWFACGKDDTFATAFYATSVNGTRVSGTVCSGLLKGNTIRLD